MLNICCICKKSADDAQPPYHGAILWDAKNRRFATVPTCSKDCHTIATAASATDTAPNLIERGILKFKGQQPEV